MDRRSLIRNAGIAGVLATGIAPAVHAQAAIRWRALALAGGMAGMAGSALVLTSGIQFGVGTVNGMGFLALAACSFGSGRFLRLLLAVAGFSWNLATKIV